MPCVIWYKSEVFCIYRLKVVSVWRQVYASIKFMQAQSLQCQIFGCYIARIRFTVWSHQLTPLEHQQCGTLTWARLRGTHPCSPNRVGRVNSVPLHCFPPSMPPLHWQERVYPYTGTPTLFPAHYKGNEVINSVILSVPSVEPTLTPINLWWHYATYPQVQLEGTAPTGELQSPSHPNHQHRW